MNHSKLLGIGIVAVLLVHGLVITGLAFWTDNNLDYWVSYTKGVPTNVPYWVSWVASVPYPVTFVLDIGASVARYFI